ncbi:YhdP family protein [Limnohabitans parvus]|uniref:TIGR02099 family protein n=1 Tax=Limnohabitans parvus II-B4 TaxID=1293052 RepID=A0A315EER2_9BURK|nr:YhdP family protein [Limnohabitans parvus]PUE54324.1 TIGR02099 family protein [Limnohabitans parvus II-B4]
MFVPSLPTFPRLSLALSHVIRAIAWVLLVLGVLLGMAWGTLHFWIVPRIGDYRPALERLAQQSIGVPVRIGQISAESTGWAPSFELRNIELLDREGQPGLHLPKVVIAISVQSALALKLEQLVLDAPELDIRLTAEGAWRVAGLDWAPNTRSDGAAADWLFSQREVIVRGGTVRWTNEHRPHQPLPGLLSPLTQKTSTPPTNAHTPPVALALRDVDLVLRNSARHHDVRLDATPPQEWGSRFVGMGRFRRSLLSIHPGQWADWTGQVYAHFPEVDVAQLGQHVPLGVDIATGTGSLRLWSDVARGQWTGGLADVNLTGLQTTWASDAQALVLERLSGRLGARVSALGFEVSTQHLAFVSANGVAWPGGNVSLEYTHPEGKNPARGQIQADHLDLFALREVALRMPLPAGLHERLQQQDISGQVGALKWRWQGDWQSPERYDGQVTLEGLSLPPPTLKVNDKTPQRPGLQGAQAKVSMTQDGGQVTVSMGSDGAVFLPGILDDAEVRVQSLLAEATFKREAGQWRVPQWKLKLANADLQGEWQGKWQAAANGNGPGTLDLQGQIKQIDASRAHRYLPVTLPVNVRQYVRDAVVKGVYSDVQVKLKGDLARLPFADPKEGEFRFAGRLRDIELDYLPAALLPPKSLPWPRLYKLNGLLVFDRLGMKLTDASARAGDARTGLSLTAGQADIADMAHQAVLNVSADNKASATQVLTLVQKSPLDALLSGALRQTQATGTVQTRFKLTIPLLTPQNTKVQGTVVLAGNDLRMSPATPLLEKAQGTVQFTETGFTLGTMQARVLGGPVRIEGGLRTSPATVAETGMQLRAQGQITAEGLRQAKEFAPLNELAQYASGATTYSAQLGWRQGQPEWSVQSPLEGLALQLPSPLGKTAAARVPLSLRVRVQNQSGVLQDQLQFEWGSVASANYVRDLSGAEPVVLRGSLSLGTQAPALPATGVSATVALDRFSVNDWENLLPASLLSGEEKSGTGKTAWRAYLPTRLGLQANTITADGRTLHQVVAGGVREDLTWRVNVDARELSGHVVYRQPSREQLGHLFARLSRLNLPPSSVAEVEGLLEAPPANLPSLDIVVEQLELRGKNLGRIEIEAVNTEQQKSRVKSAPEWQLNKFNLTVPEATLRSTGRWLTAGEGGHQRKTEMNFKLDVTDAGALLTRLGTPNALRGGTGQLEGTVSWQGSPMALHYPSMSGQFGVKMGRGQFLKADAGAAKLLGVLSLQALPRRLLLDFRDVFYEGFAFDSVRGDVTITQGIATTRNMQIKGVNALVQLDGSADIAHETQKLRVVILPALDAGTASLVAGIALNPVIGLTAFLAQLFLQNPLTKANTQEFLIDGSWAEPRVTKVSSNGADSKTSSAPNATP